MADQPRAGQEPIGYVVLTHNIGMGWQDDWDGRVHPTRDQGVAEFVSAKAALGDGVKLGVLYEEEVVG